MKRAFRILPLLVALAIAYSGVNAQEAAPVKTTRWTPEQGYWIAESNTKQPKQCTLYFYTNNHELIYRESIEGMKLNLESRRVKMRLKKVLERSLLAWQQQRLAKENEGLVISLLQRK